jgi:predicted PurR-regulated permease PerM
MDHLISTFGKWLRAQAILMGLTFAETAVGLAVAGVEYFLLLALVVAFVDALPVLGSGTVLLPWGIVTLFTGNPAKGVLIILTFLIVSLVRGLTEPRLVGKQIGLHPLATVASMYIGFKAIGIWGLLLFPIAVIMLKQLQEWDYIRIWK